MFGKAYSSDITGDGPGKDYSDKFSSDEEDTDIDFGTWYADVFTDRNYTPVYKHQAIKLVDFSSFSETIMASPTCDPSL